MYEFTENSLAEMLSHDEYIALTEKILTQKSQEEPYNKAFYLDYTKVNHERILKILKTITLEKKVYNALNEGIQQWTWILITEPWCGDASFIHPVLYAMTIASNESIDFKIVLRDKNHELMNHFLTNGGMAIPILICLDAKKNVLGSWGPRPNALQEKLEEWKIAFGEEFTLEEKIKQVNRWYIKDKSESTQTELLAKIKQWKKIQYVE